MGRENKKKFNENKFVKMAHGPLKEVSRTIYIILKR